MSPRIHIRKPRFTKYVRILLTIAGATITIAAMAAIIVLIVSVRDLSDQITRNRASNVSTWCSAINRDTLVLEQHDRSIRQHDPAVRATQPLALPHLNCQRLVQQTRSSN